MTKIEELCRVYYELPTDNAPLTGNPKLLLDALNEICTEEAAEAALYCNKEPKTCREIATETGIPIDELEPKLNKAGEIGLVDGGYNDAIEVGKILQYRNCAKAASTHFTSQLAHRTEKNLELKERTHRAYIPVLTFYAV